MPKRKRPGSFTDVEPECKQLKSTSLINLDNRADETKESMLLPERSTDHQGPTVYFYMKRCGVLAANGHYSSVLSVFNEGMKTSSSVCNSDEFYDLLFFLLWDALDEGGRIAFATTEETLLLIVQDIEQNPTGIQKDHTEELAPFCSLLIPLAHFAVRNSEEKERLKSVVKQLVKVFHVIDDMYPLLHNITSLLLASEGHLVRQHIADIIKLVVDCGADVNTVDLQGNTPLHEVALSGGDNTEGTRSVAKGLLDNEAHTDSPNIRGQTALDVANPAVKAVLYQRYPLSLQCLAASTVVLHNMPYSCRVPTAVENFIKLHTPGQAG